MIKILLINTVPTEKNGITNVIYNYLRALNTNEITFDFVSLNQPDDFYVHEVEKKGGRLYVLPRLNGTIGYWKSLRKLIRMNRYDAVHIHGNSHTTVLELTAAKAAGCVVRMVHAHTTTCAHVVVHKLLTPLFNALCTHGLSCGEAAGRFMYGNKPFMVVNNGVDTDKFAFCAKKRDILREQYGFEGRKVIGHVGYFSVVKNHRWIIEVFRSLLEKDKGYRLLLIGDGELRGEIAEKAKDYGILDNITFTGNINNVDEMLNAMDLVLMPSLFEGLPLTLIEQQANGLQCVCSDAITTEADKTGNLRFVSLDNSAEEWASEVESFLKTDDRELRSRIAIERIREAGYSIEEEAMKLSAYYFNAVHS